MSPTEVISKEHQKKVLEERIKAASHNLDSLRFFYPGRITAHSYWEGYKRRAEAELAALVK